MDIKKIINKSSSHFKRFLENSKTFLKDLGKKGIQLLVAWIIMLILSLIVIILILNGTNEILAISIPIIFFEMIPRFYSYNALDKNSLDMSKFDKIFKEVKEDQFILLLCIVYISALVGYTALNVNFKDLLEILKQFLTSLKSVRAIIVFLVTSFLLMGLSRAICSKYFKEYYK